MLRVLTLNLNHRTRPKLVPSSLIEVIGISTPDVVIFTEYVQSSEPDDLRHRFTEAGFLSVAISESVNYQLGRWNNQILIASRQTIESSSSPLGGPDSMSRTNTLTVRTSGLQITGLRVPAYTSTREWYPYWTWLNRVLDGDVVIGDFNADPERPRKWDRVLDKLACENGWFRAKVDGSWSYRGTNGSTSKVDHVLVRENIEVRAAKYIQDPFVPKFTDHAALLVEIDT